LIHCRLHSHLFCSLNHDAAKLAHYWPCVPTAGFFAAGEFGPIGRRNFLYCFTASVALWG
jgi:small ligand-binding sensory domain FIST